MKLCKVFKIFFLILFFLVFISLCNYINKTNTKPKLFISKQDSTLNLNYHFLNFISAGHKRLISSIIWTFTILESDHEHYQRKDLNNWMFQRFNTLSKLDPQFKNIYTFGGPYLGIIKNDVTAATLIYKKGLNIYPNDTALLKNAGFHFYFEDRDLNLSTQIYDKLIKSGSTDPLTRGTYARLLSNQGELADALTILKKIYENITLKNSIFAIKLQEYIFSLQIELDLKCLNSSMKTNKCSLTDPYGIRYEQGKNGGFLTKSKWIPYRPKGTFSNPPPKQN